MTKKILSVILTFVMLFSVTAGSLTVDAASKNTVKTSISKVESKAKGFKVTWKKKSGIKGYQIQYSTSSKFKKSSTKTKTVSSAKTKSATISKLKGCNTKYYVRVRTYKVSKGKKIYSSWSSVKKATTLKHKYSKATCTKPKTCKYCNETSGKKLGHRYSDATCTKAKTCTRCKNTSGKALGHDWYADDCTSPQICLECDKEGKPVGHKFKNCVCTECGYEESYNAYDYLVEWVQENGAQNGDNIEYIYEGDSSDCYGLTYHTDGDYLDVWHFTYVSSGVSAYTSISLDNYYYWFSFYGDKVYGYLNPAIYCDDITLTYTGSKCSTYTIKQLLPLAKTSVDVVLESLRYFLLSEDLPVDLSDLGFESY